MSDKTITTKEYATKLRELYWQISLDHVKYIGIFHERKEESEEQQRYQQERYAIEEVNWAVHDVYIDLYYLENLIRHTNIRNLPEFNEDELGNIREISLTELVNKIRKCYWQALVSRREWENEPGGKEFLRTNHNYDYRINGLRKVFTIFGLESYYSDLDELIRQVHYRSELTRDGSNKYIQFDPETGEDAVNPKLPQAIKI